MSKGISKHVSKPDFYPLIKPYLDADRIRVCEIEQGMTFLDAGAEGLGIHYVLSGIVRVYSISYEGKQILLDELKEPAFCGHISKLRGFNFESTLVAGSDCTVLAFSDEAFTELMEQDAFAVEFYRSTSRRIYYNYQKMLIKTLFSQREIIAGYLLEHRQDDCLAVSLKDMQEDLGISRRNLFYQMRQLQEEGLLEKTASEYRICKPGDLQTIAQNLIHFRGGLAGNVEQV